MTKNEFINSIKFKIREYAIPTTIKEAFKYKRNILIYTKYNDDSIELVDAGIEWFLCSKSAYYFISHYGWIPFPGKGDIPYNLYYYQKEILKEAPDKKKLVFLKTRQCGISTLFALYCLWKSNFHESEYIDVISTLQKKARAFVGKMEPTLKRLPSFLKTEVVNRNQSVVRWANGSQVLSESASERAGRGDSLSLLILDEAAHYLSDRLTRGIIAAAMPTLSVTGGDVIIISTPNGTSGAGAYYYEQVNQLQVSGNKENAKLVEIDWWEVPDQEDILPHKGYNPELERAVLRGYYNNKEVREEYREYFKPIAENWRDNDWLNKQYDELGNILYKQEVMHNFIVGENQVFTDDILERVRERINKSKILSENILGNAQVKGLIIWKLPLPKHRYILGVDVGKGTSNDYSAIQILDVESYEQVAEFHAKIGTKLFGRLVKKVAKFYNHGFVVVECNGIGEAVFNEIYHHDTDPYENVYKRLVTKNGLKIMTGWDTNVKSRKLMTNSLIDWITVDNLWEELNLNSSRLYIEFTTWIWNGDKPDHAEGAHDDLIIALGLCLYLRNKAINFGESFLINEKGQEINSGMMNEESYEEEEEDKGFSISMTEDETETLLQKRHNCNKEQYEWLIG